MRWVREWETPPQTRRCWWRSFTWSRDLHCLRISIGVGVGVVDKKALVTLLVKGLREGFGRLDRM